MRAADFYEFTRRQPFEPFRIHTTDGRAYEIRHPDMVMPLVSRVVIAVGTPDGAGNGEPGVPDRLEHISLLHVLRIEEIVAESEAT